jgi:dolichyl-diphosphooligosaccharide--protein glycosyltransferase
MAGLIAGLDFDKLWDDLQWRAETVLKKSNILFKYFFVFVLVSFAFALRVIGFVRVRGINDVDDIFNLAMNTKLSSAGLSNFFHNQDAGIFFDTSATFPGLTTFVSVLHWLLHLVGVAVSTQTLYTLSGPFFASCTAYATYLLGKELKDQATGLVAGVTIALLPGFYALSVDGSSANVVGGTFMLVLTLYFFVKSINTSERQYAVYAALAYFALASLWSGYIFASVFLAAYVGYNLVLNKCDDKLYNTYTIFYVLSTLLTFVLPVGGFKLLLHIEQFPALAVFVVLQLVHRVGLSVSILKPVGALAPILFLGAAAIGLLMPSRGLSVFWTALTSSGQVSWLTFFRDYHLVLFLFPAGIFMTYRKRNVVNSFFLLYAVLGLGLASLSASFTAVFFPAATIFAALSLTTTLRAFLKNQEAPVKKRTSKPISKEINVAVLAGVTAIIGFFLVYSFSAATHYSVYRPVTLLPAVSHTDNRLHLLDDLREAVAWLRQNTREDARILTWKGLGQQLASLARTSVLGPDPNQIDPSLLAQVAEAFRSDEKTAAGIASRLGASYVLVTFGGRTAFDDDDLAHVGEIAGTSGQFGEDSLLFKLSYRGFADVFTHPSAQPGLDLARGHPVAIRPQLYNFEEVFTSEHWLVRLYKVLPLQADQPQH